MPSAKCWDLLDEYQLADNTLVVFFSDNGGSGDADNSPLRGAKAQMFEGGIRVPFIARFPGRIPADSVSDEFLTSLELFPMFAGLAGAKLPADIVYDGFDMLPVLTGQEKSERTEMFWERRDDRAARVGNYKWVQSAGGNGLFDLSSDVGEKHDLSAENPEMLAKLAVAICRSGRKTWRPPNRAGRFVTIRTLIRGFAYVRGTAPIGMPNSLRNSELCGLANGIPKGILFQHFGLSEIRSNPIGNKRAPRYHVNETRFSGRTGISGRAGGYCRPVEKIVTARAPHVSAADQGLC